MKNASEQQLKWVLLLKGDGNITYIAHNIYCSTIHITWCITANMVWVFPVLWYLLNFATCLYFHLRIHVGICQIFRNMFWSSTDILLIIIWLFTQWQEDYHDGNKRAKGIALSEGLRVHSYLCIKPFSVILTWNTIEADKTTNTKNTSIANTYRLLLLRIHVPKDIFPALWMFWET